MVLSSDTLHHRYMLSQLQNINYLCLSVVFETSQIQAPFKTGPVFDNDENAFEQDVFGKISIKDLPTVTVEDINSPESQAAVSRFRPDLGVVFGTKRLSNEIIDLFPRGLLNVHRGIAQKYRGLDSDLWAIYHRDYESIGTTIHRVDSTLDTGDIVAQRTLRLFQEMRCHKLRYHTTLIATELMSSALQDYENGCEFLTPQDSVGRYYTFMPLDLKRVCRSRFDLYCKRLSE